MASKAFEAGVRSIFAPRLEALGFTRKGIRYVRPSPPWLIQAIKLEQDKYNGSGFCRFTLVLARRLVAATSPGAMLERGFALQNLFDTPMGVEIGPLTEICGGYRYDYLADDTAGIEAALSEALADIERYGLFWLRWGFARPFRGRDRSRADAADSRWRAFVDGFQPQSATPE